MAVRVVVAECVVVVVDLEANDKTVNLPLAVQEVDERGAIALIDR